MGALSLLHVCRNDDGVRIIAQTKKSAATETAVVGMLRRRRPLEAGVLPPLFITITLLSCCWLEACYGIVLSVCKR